MFEVPQVDPVIAARDDERMLRLQCLGYANAMGQRFATGRGADEAHTHTTDVDTAEALVERAKVMYAWITENEPDTSGVQALTEGEVPIGGTM